ncbi:hypothetical protein MRY82_05565 [bacterium]|nr:hypothetical protein [bacterium]
MYISITGLKPKNFIARLKFYRYAIPCFNQARNASGNVYCQTKNVNGYAHTLTAWESKEDMQRFLYSGVHMQAIKQFNNIATGKTHGYESETIPSWQEAIKIWQDKAKIY